MLKIELRQIFIDLVQGGELKISEGLNSFVPFKIHLIFPTLQNMHFLLLCQS